MPRESANSMCLLTISIDGGEGSIGLLWEGTQEGDIHTQTLKALSLKKDLMKVGRLPRSATEYRAWRRSVEEGDDGVWW